MTMVYGGYGIHIVVADHSNTCLLPLICHPPQVPYC